MKAFLKYLKIIAILSLLTLMTLVIIQNTEVVELRFFVYQVSMSRILLLILTLFFGFIIGFLTARLTGRAHARTTPSGGSDATPPFENQAPFSP